MSDDKEFDPVAPLTTWTCDICGEPVSSDRNDGMVVWRSPQREYYDFKIVHKMRCDPGNREGYWSSMDVAQFLGPDGLAMLLSWLSVGPLKGGGGIVIANMDEYVDLVRRFQTPYYEEARPWFGDEKTYNALSDANEYMPYLPSTLQRIAEKTLGR